MLGIDYVTATQAAGQQAISLLAVDFRRLSDCLSQLLTFHRYLWQVPDDMEDVFVHWDADMGTDQDLFIDFYGQNPVTGDLSFLDRFDIVRPEVYINLYIYIRLVRRA